MPSSILNKTSQMSIFKCGSCDYISNQKGNVQRHIKILNHTTDIITLPVDTKCINCDQTFATIPVLKNHLKICGISKPLKLIIGDKNGLPIKVCTDCNKNSNDIDFHIRGDKTGYHSKRCKECQNIYRRKLKRKDITNEETCLRCNKSSKEVFFDYEKIGTEKIYYSNCQNCRNKDTIKERICHICNVSSLDTKFRTKNYRDNYTNYCKWCYKCEMKEYRSYKNKVKEYKRGSVERNLEWSLTDKEAIELFEQNCYYCGQEKTDEIFIGIDRIDNFQGYTVENTISCCFMCNGMKSTHVQQDFIQKCIEIAKLHSEEIL